MASPWGEAVERSETDEGNNLAYFGHFIANRRGPLIRPFGAPSPQGEGIRLTNRNSQDQTDQPVGALVDHP